MGGIASGIETLMAGALEAELASLDAKLQAELEAAGVADETTEEKYDKQLADLEGNLSKAATIEEKAKIKADIKELKAEKVKALEREKIEDKYAEKRKQLEYDIAMVKWKFQLASAISQAPIAVLNAYSSGWAAGPFAGPVLSSLYAGLAAVASGLQIAAVTASKPSFQTGGIVPGNSIAGDNVSAMVNSGEMILNGAQQKRLFNVANGGGGGSNLQKVSISEEVTWSEIYQASKNGDLFIDSRAIQDR